MTLELAFLVGHIVSFPLILESSFCWCNWWNFGQMWLGLIQTNRMSWSTALWRIDGKNMLFIFLKNHMYILPNYFWFDSFCNCFIFCFSLLHCLWLFMGLGSMVVDDVIVWKHMFTISSNWSYVPLRLSS